MSAAWLLRNIIAAWQCRASAADFVERLRWLYADRLPSPLSWREREIGFRFPEPIGRIRVRVRANGGSDAFIFGEVFHHRYYELPLARQPETILDLGANAGFTAVYFGRRYPRAQIACVEPIADNVRLLRRNCELNGIRARVFEAAIGADDGEVVMALERMDYGHRVLEPQAVHDGRTVTVRATSAETLLRELGWTRIGLLKVDIEGYEKVLFAGECAWLARVDALCIECHEGFRDADLERLARNHGFLAPVRLPGTWLLSRA